MKKIPLFLLSFLILSFCANCSEEDKNDNNKQEQDTRFIYGSLIGYYQKMERVKYNNSKNLYIWGFFNGADCYFKITNKTINKCGITAFSNNNYKFITETSVNAYSIGDVLNGDLLSLDDVLIYNFVFVDELPNFLEDKQAAIDAVDQSMGHYFYHLEQDMQNYRVLKLTTPEGDEIYLLKSTSFLLSTTTFE